MTKQEAQQKIDEATAAYQKATEEYPVRHPKREKAFQTYKQIRIECTEVLYK